MATKKRNYEAVKDTVKKLTAAAKMKNITPEQKIELAEARELLRRHSATERIKHAKAAMIAGKREALLRILLSNGIEEENQLKTILRYIHEAKPGLIPARQTAPKPEQKQ